METDTQPNNPASGIAASILELVERTNGPVTLAQIERDVPGFAKQQPPAWCLDHPGGEMFIWDGMTEEGHTALCEVMYGHKATIQLVNALPYLLEGCVIKNGSWHPIVLLPARAANLETPHWLMRASPDYLAYCMKRAAEEGKTGYRLLTPRPVRFTADQFSL